MNFKKRRDFFARPSARRSIVICGGFILFCLIMGTYWSLNDLSVSDKYTNNEKLRRGFKRRSKDNKYDMCLVSAVAIDTSLHLFEWVAWHNLLGVDCFHLLIDKEKHKSDTARLILHKLEHLPSLVKLESCTGHTCMSNRYHALTKIQTSNSASYVAAVDTDEFIRFEDGSLQNVPTFVHDKLRANEKSDILYLIRYHFSTSKSNSPLRVTNIPTSPQMASCSGLKWGKYIGTGNPTWKDSGVHTWKKGKAIFSNGTVLTKAYQQQVNWNCPTQPLAINHYERYDVCMKKLEYTAFNANARHRSINKCMSMKYLNRDYSSKDRIYRHFEAITMRISDIFNITE